MPCEAKVRPRRALTLAGSTQESCPEGPTFGPYPPNQGYRASGLGFPVEGVGFRVYV